MKAKIDYQVDPLDLEQWIVHPESKTMQIAANDLDYPHEVANPKCRVSWCDTTEYPRKCDCGGLIHADFGDEDSNCNYWLYTQCDQCGKAGTA